MYLLTPARACLYGSAGQAVRRLRPVDCALNYHNPHRVCHLPGNDCATLRTRLRFTLGCMRLDWLGCATFRCVLGELVAYLDAYIDRVATAPKTGVTVADVDRA